MIIFGLKYAKLMAGLFCLATVRADIEKRWRNGDRRENRI